MVLRRKILEKKEELSLKQLNKLMSDNVTLKKAVVKLWKNQENNEEKVKQFDQLAIAYQQMWTENSKLKKGIDILKYLAKDKCNDRMMRNYNNFDSPGGPGIF